MDSHDIISFISGYAHTVYLKGIKNKKNKKKFKINYKKKKN